MEVKDEMLPQDETEDQADQEQSFEEMNEDETIEENQLDDQCDVSQDLSLASQSSHECTNDLNTLDSNNVDRSTASITPGADEEENIDGGVGRRKYKRKVYDLNATREKLPRRAKDLPFESDPDFVKVPPPAQQVRGRGRGRGRKKLLDVDTFDSNVQTAGDNTEPVFNTPTRGRGRGRGRGGGRTPKIKTPRGAARPRLPKFQVLEEDTRMSVENSFGGSATFSTPVQGQVMSESPWKTLGTPNVKKKLGSREIFDASSQAPITAAQLVEYAWPCDDTNAELWMVQEQVISYLSIKGNFKRKYPDMKRRAVEMVERDWLRERNVVNETQANLGLTALLSCEVLDLFFNVFPDKYEEYLAAQSEKKEQAYKSKTKGVTAVATPAAPAEKKPFDPRLRAIKAAAKWNVMFNKERVEERLHCLDLQTFTVQIPRRPTVLKPISALSDPYPVAVIPGQFSSFFKTYSPYQLNCLPIGTVMRGPLVDQPDNTQRRKRRPTNGSSTRADSTIASQTESDDTSSSSDDSSSDSSDEDSSSSSPDDDGESDDEDRPYYARQPGICKLCRGDRRQNKTGRPEPLVRCAKCQTDGHLSCWNLDINMMPQVAAYSWECNDCKTCDQCHDPADEEKMLFCDFCDRGYHTYCVGLRSIPEGRWNCPFRSCTEKAKAKLKKK